MAARFFNDGRLRLDDGTVLDRHPDWLDQEQTRVLLPTVDHVFYTFYPRSDVITNDPKRVAALVAEVAPGGIITARCYSGRGKIALVFDEAH